MATIRISAAERYVQVYEEYLCDIQALARSTIIHYVPFVREFLKHRFGKGKVTLSKLRAADVVRFVQVQAPRLQLKRAKLMTTVHRSFLRYVRYRGDITLDLAAAVPVVANWSLPSIPRGISAGQTQKLLASIDRRTAGGRRDYAILPVLARLGVRSSEVAFLELDVSTGTQVNGACAPRVDNALSYPYLRTSAKPSPPTFATREAEERQSPRISAYSTQNERSFHGNSSDQTTAKRAHEGNDAERDVFTPTRDCRSYHFGVCASILPRA
jgi:hypothetical protein